MENKDVQIVAIERNNRVILSPSDDEILYAGDTLILLGENQNLNKLAEIIEKS